MRKFSLLMAVCIFSLFLYSCSNIDFMSENEAKPVKMQAFYMGTIITGNIYGKNAEKSAEEIKTRMEQIEKTMTINTPGGEVNLLNDNAGKGSVKVGGDTLHVINTALKYSKLSKGTFDVTIGPLVKAWGIATDHARIPDDAEIKDLLSLTGYNSIKIHEDEKAVSLEKPGQILDLGGIAKGYAGDEAIRILKENNIKSAFVNLGGNIVTLGNKPDGSSWSIGVQNPRAVNGKYVGIIKVTGKTIVSSGDYERFFEEDGIRYHHILDPKTGYPARSGLMGTTIVADSSIEADALSTSVFVLGLEEGMKLIEALDGVEALFITEDKKIYVTSGLKESFTFSDESKEFEYVEKR